MKKKKTSRVRMKKNQKRKIDAFFVFFIFVLFFFVGIFLYRTYAVPLPETPQNDMKEIPKEIKGAMTKHPAEASYRIPILMYHYVEYVKDSRDITRQLLDIVPAVFAKQLETLKNAHYTFMNMRDVADVLDGKKMLPKKPIVLTFDDGYRDFYTDVLPIIKQYNVKVVSYVVPGFNNLPNNMDSWQIYQLEQSGLVEIGAHTVHHISLKDAPKAVVEYEVTESKKMLEDQLHIPVVSFAYPYGSFDQQAIDIVKEAGFRTATTTVPGIEANTQNRYFLFRIRPGDRVGDDLLSFLSQNSFNAF